MIIFFSWPKIIIIIIDHLLKARCQLSNGGWLCDKIMRTCNYGLPIHISKFVCHLHLLWQWQGQGQWTSSYSYSFFISFQHLCHLLFVIGRAQGQAGWVFCINTLISQCFGHMQVFCINTSISIQHLLLQANNVALLYRWKYKYKSFLSTAWSQYSIFVCRHIETRPSIHTWYLSRIPRIYPCKNFFCQCKF